MRARLGLPVLVATLCINVVPASADDIFHDFQLGQTIAAECIDSAATMEAATACVGEPMRHCRDPESHRPWKATRDCDWRGYKIGGWGEARIWEDVYQTEVMRKLQWARDFDAWYFSVDGISDGLASVMQAELAWLDYAYALCRLADLPDAEKAYDYRKARDRQCLAHMFAERAFQLRSLTNLSPER